MEIRQVNSNRIKPYEKNAKRHPQKQIDQIAESLKKFGWQQPIVIDKKGVIVIGHGRYEAARQLKMKTVPCVVADELSDDEIRMLRLADNKLNESEWDFDLLQEELDGLDFGDLDLDFDIPEQDDEEEKEKDWQLYRTTRSYENLEHAIYEGVGEYDIPQLSPVTCDCRDWIGFNFAKTCTEPETVGVHFFIDDYQFTRLWERPALYLPLLQSFQVVMSPDFSMYTDFPKAIQIYNHYRKHWLGAYWSEAGITVIPTIAWGDERSFDFCFDGEPAGSCVAISTVGTQNNKEAKMLFEDGYKEMIRRLKPTQIIVNGNMPENLKSSDIEFIEIPAFQGKWND